jgi:hypothetical protein
MVCLSQLNLAIYRLGIIAVSAVGAHLRFIGEFTGFMPDTITPIFCIAMKI